MGFPRLAVCCWITTLNNAYTRNWMIPPMVILYLGAHDGTAHIWNVNNGMLLRRMNPRIDVKHTTATNTKVNKPEDVLGLVWSEENNRIGECLN